MAAVTTKTRDGTALLAAMVMTAATEQEE